MRSKALLAAGLVTAATAGLLLVAPVASAHSTNTTQTKHEDTNKKDCGKKPTPSPTPKPSHSPSPTPTPSTTPKPSTTPTPTPTPGGKGGNVLGDSTQAQPASLPETGAEAGLSALIGLPAVGVAARAYLRSRR
jgi:outer membrane biosynthesis protein TonB